MGARCASLNCPLPGEYEYIITAEMDTQKGKDLYGDGIVTLTVLLCEGHFHNVGSIKRLVLPEYASET